MQDRRSVWDWLAKQVKLFDVLLDGSPQDAIDALKQIKAEEEAKNAAAREVEETLERRLRNQSDS